MVRNWMHPRSDTCSIVLLLVILSYTEKMPQLMTPQHYNMHLILIRRERLWLTGCFSSHFVSKQADNQFWFMSLEESSVLLSGPALLTGTFSFLPGELVIHRYQNPNQSHAILFYISHTPNSNQDCQKGYFSLFKSNWLWKDLAWFLGLSSGYVNSVLFCWELVWSLAFCGLTVWIHNSWATCQEHFVDSFVFNFQTIMPAH